MLYLCSFGLSALWVIEKVKRVLKKCEERETVKMAEVFGFSWEEFETLNG